jgi:hypothetical protein
MLGICTVNLLALEMKNISQKRTYPRGINQPEYSKRSGVEILRVKKIRYRANIKPDNDI